eukprot:SAG31_NODE_7330_length_1717_cov_2.583436_1_plen_136_part_10
MYFLKKSRAGFIYCFFLKKVPRYLLIVKNNKFNHLGVHLDGPKSQLMGRGHATVGRRVLLGVYPDGPQPQLVTRGLWGAATRCGARTIVSRRALIMVGIPGVGGRSRFDPCMVWYGMPRFSSLISIPVLLVLESDS